MKNIVKILLLLVSCNQLFAQAPDISAKSKEEMKRLSYFAGDWKGEAVYKNAKGQVTITQTEHVEWKLQGLVLTFEGTGKQIDAARSQDKIVFQAFAVLHFDQTDQQFKFKSFIKEGHTTEAYFKIIDVNKFEWGFDIGSAAKMRYLISLDSVKKSWREVGEYSPDGNTWMKSVELNLIKQ